MNKDEIFKRTRVLGVSIILFTRLLPNSSEFWPLKNQIIRSGTSIGVNYRSAYRARSKVEFIAKMGIVEEETDETLFWFEIIEELLTDNANVKENISALKREHISS